MGHERIGELPKTQRWLDIVEAMASLQGQAGGAAEIVRQTAENVRARFRLLEREPSVLAAFKFLVALAVSSRSESPELPLADLGIDLPADPTPLGVVKALREWVAPQAGRAEHSRLAELAAGDAIATWYVQRGANEGRLFTVHEDGYDVWRAATTGAGFCELSRHFFGKLTERYLNYFLERAASGALPTIQQRDQFQRELQEHVDRVSRHAFEMAKITQSFAAGWFNKYAKEHLPSDRQIRGFLSVAFGKLREELRREGGQA